MSLDSFVISLKTQYKRHQHIENIFKNLNIQFSFFDAINTSQVDCFMQEHALKITAPLLSEGEVACYLSHFCLWKKVVDNNLSYIAIFEDDIYLANDSYELLTDLNWLPDGFDVIKLETMHERTFVNIGSKLIGNRRLLKMGSSHMGAAGYLLSYKGALKLIHETEAEGIKGPVDHLIFDWLISDKNVYLVDPAICIQDKVCNETKPTFDSVLEPGRSQTLKPTNEVKVKPKGISKIKREIRRINNQVVLYSSMFARGYREKLIKYEE